MVLIYHYDNLDDRLIEVIKFNLDLGIKSKHIIKNHPNFTFLTMSSKSKSN